MERCLEMTEKFVMKPQREGGGKMQKFSLLFLHVKNKHARLPNLSFIII